MSMDIERNQQIAAQILHQLGGQVRLKTMTGAKDFVAIENGLQFKLPGTLTKNRINCVRIVLDPSDTYNLEFQKIRLARKKNGMIDYENAVKTMAKLEGIYVDDLVSVVSEETGLALSLGPVPQRPRV